MTTKKEKISDIHIEHPTLTQAEMAKEVDCSLGLVGEEECPTEQDGVFSERFEDELFASLLEGQNVKRIAFETDISEDHIRDAITNAWHRDGRVSDA